MKLPTLVFPRFWNTPEFWNSKNKGEILDETPCLTLKIFQKSGVSFYPETPPNSNSRDFEIVQIFGIEITAGIFQSVTLLQIDSAP